MRPWTSRSRCYRSKEGPHGAGEHQRPTEQPTGASETTPGQQEEGDGEPPLHAPTSPHGPHQQQHLLGRKEEEQEDDLPPLQKPTRLHESAQSAQKEHKKSLKNLNLKWDKSSGWVGDPPGLSNSSGSSQQPEVKAHKEFSIIDDALFPPMDNEELEMVNSFLVEAGKLLTNQADKGDQRGQQEQGQHQEPQQQQPPQDQDSTNQHSLKWDLPTGRVGDPPGLDLCLGSSQQQQVECKIFIKHETDPECFPLWPWRQ